MLGEYIEGCGCFLPTSLKSVFSHILKYHKSSKCILRIHVFVSNICICPSLRHSRTDFIITIHLKSVICINNSFKKQVQILTNDILLCYYNYIIINVQFSDTTISFYTNICFYSSSLRVLT